MGYRLQFKGNKLNAKQNEIVEHKLKNNEKLKREYVEIVENRLKEGIVEKISSKSSGSKIFYTRHKPVIRENATTTLVRNVFDARTQSAPTTNSINNCMHKGLHYNQTYGTSWSELE